MRAPALALLILAAAGVADHGVAARQLHRARPPAATHGTMPPHATFFPFETREKAIAGHRTKSDRFLLLNGDWAFRRTMAGARPRGFERPAFDVSGWGTMTVPGDGQSISAAGSNVPVSVASYRRDVAIPANWMRQDIVLHIGAAGSPYRIWVNGMPVGHVEDPKMPGEFDVTRAVHPGRNVVAVQLHRRPDGHDLEVSDVRAASGITREVYLMAVPQLRIHDFFVHAGLDPSQTLGKLAIDVAIAPGAAVTVRYVLLDQGRQVLAGSAAVAAAPGARTKTLRGDLPGVRPWTAETPDLYFLLVELLDEKGAMIQSSYVRIGFRDVTRHLT